PMPEPAGDPGPLAILSDSLVIETLLLAGRMPEASAHLAGSRLDIGPVASPFLTRLVGVTRGAVLVLSGRYDEAEESLEAAPGPARWSCPGWRWRWTELGYSSASTKYVWHASSMSSDVISAGLPR